MVAKGTYTYDDHMIYWRGTTNEWEMRLLKSVYGKGEGEVIIVKVYWTPLCIFPDVVLRISVKLEVGS